MAERRLLQALAPALIACELGALWGPAPIKVVAGLALTLVLPGLVMTRLLARSAAMEAERLLLVLGLSVVTAVLTGICLNAAHIRLTTHVWAIALGSITAAGLALVATVEGRKTGAKHLPKFPRCLVMLAPWARGLESLRRSFALARTPLAIHPADVVRAPAGAIAVVSLVLALAVAGAVEISGSTEHYHGSGFTELWAISERSSPPAVGIGLISHELRGVRYRIQVSVDGRKLRAQDVSLRPNQTWRFTEPVGSGRMVDITLTKPPSSLVYRQARLSIG